MKKLFLILALIPTLAFANEGHDSDPLATSAIHPKEMKWEFDGFFGRFDKASAQRGYQVYKEICSACHSLKLVAYRNLTEIGFSEVVV